MPRRIDCFKPTSDPWYGEFKIANDARHQNQGFVHVSCMQLHDKTWRVCVWGNDDCGMEWDQPHESNARTMFTDICLMDDVTSWRLQELGFVRA